MLRWQRFIETRFSTFFNRACAVAAGNVSVRLHSKGLQGGEAEGRVVAAIRQRWSRPECWIYFSRR